MHSLTFQKYIYIHWAGGEASPAERVRYVGFPRTCACFNFCFCFFERTGVKGISATHWSYSRTRCHSSMSCWIFGWICLSDTFSWFNMLLISDDNGLSVRATPSWVIISRFCPSLRTGTQSYCTCKVLAEATPACWITCAGCAHSLNRVVCAHFLLRNVVVRQGRSIFSRNEFNSSQVIMHVNVLYGVLHRNSRSRKIIRLHLLRSKWLHVIVLNIRGQFQYGDNRPSQPTLGNSIRHILQTEKLESIKINIKSYL